MKRNSFSFLLCVFSFLFVWNIGAVQLKAEDPGYVSVIDMEMMILPGTQAYLEKAIENAESTNAKLLVVKLSTPGGILQTSQKMIQAIFKSKVPVVIYVSPSGGTATSAGVFITMAGHIAAMAPGTSIGAAHPVAGDGKDIEGDMRKKAEEMTIAMVKSIAEQRGRNVEWAEKAVRESASLTEKEALEASVVDVVASDMDQLLKVIASKEVTIGDEKVKLADYSSLPRRNFEMSFTDEVTNVLANPNIAALLWLAATTGLSIELYNPGAIFPGVVGVICLILALAVSQIIPISYGALLLLLLGAVLIGLEFYVGSGILGLGGLVALVLGSIYLIDVTQAPGLAVSMGVIIPVALLFGGFLLLVVHSAIRARNQKAMTGNEGLVGQHGTASTNISNSGKVFVDGETWNATCAKGIIEKGSPVTVVEVEKGLVLKVEAVEES